nr:ATP synthase F0 subunit 8 [Cercopithecus cephus cephodes]
MPQLDT